MLSYVRFMIADQIRHGELEGEKIFALKENFLDNRERTGETFSLKDVSLLAPTLPTKVICIGLNYRDHAEELGLKLPEEPVVFLKPPSSLADPFQNIIYPELSRRVDYEGELAVVIGKKTQKVAVTEAENYITGFTCANDVTARDLQPQDGQWTVAKSFDTFCPVGPAVVTDLDLSNSAIKTLVNGQVKQSSSLQQLIFSVPYLVSYLSRIMTLFPGDLILTGTPGGIGPLFTGDTVTVEIEGIGKLTNTVFNN